MLKAHSQKAITLHNTVFTLRPTALVRTEEFEADSVEVISVAVKHIQPENPALPNQVAVVPIGHLRQ
ncbi:hypothetical protein [Paenibacillus brevis]|uniref:hypothetical protein n=1 Tax=Paenibacillus brevis TaxID=2841508 RepID=UPI001C0F9B6C|nr:hypothetical protein [Paenibacillus brevis]